MEPFVFLIELLFAKWLWPFSTLVLIWLGLVFATPFGKLHHVDDPRHDADRKRITGGLIEARWKKRYARAMGSTLDWIDDRLSAGELMHGLGPARIAWSSRLAQGTMMLAIAYPILFATAQWLGGNSIEISEGFKLPIGSPAARAYVAVWIGGICVASYFVNVAQWCWRLPLFALAIAILFIGNSQLETAGAPSAVAISGSFALAFAFSGIFAIAFAFTISIIATLAHTITNTISLWNIVSIFAATTIPAISALKLVSIVALKEVTYGPMTLRWCGIFLGLLSTISIMIRLNPPANNFPGQPSLIFLIGILPILNGLADFASLGLTRLLLRKGLKNDTLKLAIYDALGGITIFLLLGFATIAWLHVVRFSDGTPLMDLNGLFEGLKTRPEDYWWLGLLLVTTLVPTTVHLSIGLLTILIQYPSWIRRPIVNLLSDAPNSAIRGWLGSLAYCALVTLSLWAVILLIWGLLHLDGGIILSGLIAIFEWWARTIGAI